MAVSCPSIDRERLVLDHLSLARALAMRRSPPIGMDREDLIAIANLGLVDAAKRFDPHRGLKFSTYATMRIRGEMADAMRRLDALTRSERRDVKRIERARATFTVREHRPATLPDLAHETGLSEAKVCRLLGKAANATPLSLEMTVPGGDGQEALALHETLSDPRAEIAFEEVIEASEFDLLLRGLALLPAREQTVMRMRYLDGGATLREVGRRLGVTESRVCQIECRARFHLHAVLADSA